MRPPKKFQNLQEILDFNLQAENDINFNYFHFFFPSNVKFCSACAFFCFCKKKYSNLNDFFSRFFKESLVKSEGGK